MKPLNKTLFGGTAMAVALMLGGPALAEFPERPVEIVVPFAPGGAGDVFAGVLAAHWRDGAERALRRACAAGALATLVHGAGNCAPDAEAVDDILEAPCP